MVCVCQPAGCRMGGDRARYPATRAGPRRTRIVGPSPNGCPLTSDRRRIPTLAVAFPTASW